MSERSAVTNKGKDGKSKYSSLNLYDTYKGKSVEPQKQTVSHGRGLQSLGKVGIPRRVTPANLPSLKSENQGNDPNINLVPTSGSGWGSDDNQPEENAAPSTVPTQQPPPSQRMPQNPQMPQRPQEDPQSAKSWQPPAPSVPLQGAQHVTPAPVRSAPPTALDREFPALGMSGDQAQPRAPDNKSKDADADKDGAKEVQYGPGPSLRPQNVKSWREGGSSLNKSGGTGTGEGEAPASNSGAALDKGIMPPPPGMVPPGIMNGAQGNLPPPGSMPQFNRMMPPYMQFGPGGPGPRGMPGGPPGPRGPMPMNPYPMGYPGPPPRPGFPPNHPGAMMPPGPERGHGPPRHGDKPQMRNRENIPQPAIVDANQLKEMEELAGSKSEEGWAVVSGDVDYSEKLVFSDEEDESPKKGDKGSRPRDSIKDNQKEKTGEEQNRRSPMTSEGVPHGPPRPAWEASEREGGAQPPVPRGQPPHHGRGPQNMDQTSHQRPVDVEDERWNHQRQKQSSEMSSNIERARQRRIEEQRREEERRKEAALEKLRQLDERSAQRQKQDGDATGNGNASGSANATREAQRSDSGQSLPQENHEVVDARDSREKEWDRDRERHKERDLEHERGVDVPFSREGMVIKRQRTESGSSDGSRQGRDRREAQNFARQPTRNLPPRFLKQQQQQQQHDQPHRRPPSFTSQDQQWYGREGSRGSWGGSGPTTPTTPPFGQENRQFIPPNTRFHLQRRRQSSETSQDGPERAVFPPESKDSVREGDIPSSQATLPSRGDADDKGRGSDRGYRNQRIPSDGQPKEIPRRQDSHREIPRAPRPDARQSQDQRPEQKSDHTQDHKQAVRQEHKPDHQFEKRHDNKQDKKLDKKEQSSEPCPNQKFESGQSKPQLKQEEQQEKQESKSERQERRPEQRLDSRAEHRRDHRQDKRQDNRSDHRRDQRQDQKQDTRSEQRTEHRHDQRLESKQDKIDQKTDQRQDQKPEMVKQDQKPDQRQSVRQTSRQDSREERRKESKPSARQESKESKQDSKLEKRIDEKEGRKSSDKDHSTDKERQSNKKEENISNTRQSVPKSGTEPKAEVKAELAAKAQEKEVKEIPKQNEREKKDGGPVAEGRAHAAEPPKTAKTGLASDSRDRRPNRDSKSMPSSLVDMKSGNREKFDKNDKSDRHDKAKRRDSDREDRNNRRGGSEQSGSRNSGSRQSDSRDRRKNDTQAPEPSRAWKGGDTSQRLKLKEPSSSTNEASASKAAAKEDKLESKSSAPIKNTDSSKVQTPDQVSPEAAAAKENKDDQNEKEKKDKVDVKESGTKSKDISSDKPHDQDRSTRDRRDERDGRDRGERGERGGRTSSRGRGSVDSSRRRDDRGPSNRRDDRGPPQGRRDGRGRYDTGSRGRGYRTYSSNFRGRGRGRGDRYDSRPSYKRPQYQDEEEESWDPSSGDESTEKPLERKEASRDTKPTEVKTAAEMTETITPSEGKPNEDAKNSETKDETGPAEPERNGTERRNFPRGEPPRGEPSRRGRGAISGRRGRGGRGGSRDFGREPYRRDDRDERRLSSRDSFRERYDRGPRRDEDPRDGREFRGRRTDYDERYDRRDGPPVREPYKGKKPKPDRPPRFQKGPTRGRGRGRPSRGDRTPEGPGAKSRESGDQVSPGSGSEASKGTSRPPLPRQNSSDLNNDEWETASESSNFNDHKQRDKEVLEEGSKDSTDKTPRENSGANSRNSANPDQNRIDRRDNSRKGPPNQRQAGDRPRDRDGYRDNRDRDYDRREKSYRASREGRNLAPRGRGRGTSDRRSENGPLKRPGGPRGGQEEVPNQNHSSDVYRLDQIVLNDQRSVHDALNAASMRPKKGPMTMGRPMDTTTPVSLPLQSREKERPKPVEKKIDVLATYDLNNSYGVVVVDDVPEVIVENPDELLTPDAGFQPVLSKKQRAAEQERKKQESLSEIAKRSKLGKQMKRNKQLPPRLCGNSPIKESPMVAPIGTGARIGTLNKAPGTKPITTENISSLIGPGPAMVPPHLLGKGVDSSPMMPSPSANAWEKPLMTAPQPQVAAAAPAGVNMPPSKVPPGVPGKPESSDQHDSGVELNSDHHASNPPSQRSSPNGEAKAEARLVSDLMNAVNQQPSHSQRTSQPDWSTDMTPPSRLTAVGLKSVTEVAASSHGPGYSGSIMGRMEGVSTQANDSGIRNLSDMAASSGVIGPNPLLSQSVQSHNSPSGRPGPPSMMQSSQDQNRSNVQSPTSTAATDELIMKMERAKNLWDEQESPPPAPNPKTSRSSGNLSSQALTSRSMASTEEQAQQSQNQHLHQHQQQHRSDQSQDISNMADLSSSHLSHSAASMLPASGASEITFGSFASSNVELVDNDAPTSVSFPSLNTNMNTTLNPNLNTNLQVSMSANMGADIGDGMSPSLDADDMAMDVPSSRTYTQFSSSNTELDTPPEVYSSAGYSSKGLSLYTSTASGDSFDSDLILGQSPYDAKPMGGEEARFHQQETRHHAHQDYQQQQQQHQQRQQQGHAYQQSVILAQPLNLGSSLTSNLAGSAIGMHGGGIDGTLNGTSQSVLTHGSSGQYSFQNPDTSRLIPAASPAFLNPVSFQGTIIQPQSANLQFGLNQNTGIAPTSPAPGAAPSQQPHQTYQAPAASFLPAQTPPTNFGPMLSVSLSQPHVQGPSYLSLSSPSYTRPSHDLGLSSGLATSVIMKPQATIGGLTKTVSSVAYGSVSSVPAVQPSHIFSQQRGTSHIGGQQPGLMTTNTLIAAMQPSATPAAHHPAQGQHSSFFSGGAQVAAAVAGNSQVGSTNFFNTLGGNRSSSLHSSVQALQPVPIQLPQSTLSSQYSIAAQQQTTQAIGLPIGAPLAGYVNTFGDIGTQPKHLPRNVPSGYGAERPSSGSVLDVSSDLLSKSESTPVSLGSSLSKHIDAKPFSPNKQVSISSSTYGTYKTPDERYGMYTSKSNRNKSYEPSAPKASTYSTPPMSIGHYNAEDRKTYTQPKATASYSQPLTTSSFSHVKTTSAYREHQNSNFSQPTSGFIQPNTTSNYSRPLTTSIYSHSATTLSESKTIATSSYSRPITTLSYSQPITTSSFSQPLVTPSFSETKTASSFSQPKTTGVPFSHSQTTSESLMSSDSIGQLNTSELETESATTATTTHSSLPFSSSLSTVATTTTSTSQKPVYTQASKVSQSQPTSKPGSAYFKNTTSSSSMPTAPVFTQSLPPRSFTQKTGTSNPRMPPPMFRHTTPQMLAVLMSMQFPPPFPPGPPPPRGSQFGPPPRLPTPNPPVLPMNLPSKTSQGQKGATLPAKSSSPVTTTTQGKSSSNQGGYQVNKSKSLQGMAGPSIKLQKPPSHYGGRRPDLKMTAEELKVAKEKEREKALAATKAFFGKPETESESKETSDKSEKK